MCHVYLASDDRLNAILLGCFVKVHDTKEIAMIGNSRSWHFQLCQTIHQSFNLAGTVQKAIVSVEMQVNEIVLSHRCLGVKPLVEYQENRNKKFNDQE